MEMRLRYLLHKIIRSAYFARNYTKEDMALDFPPAFMFLKAFTGKNSHVFTFDLEHN
jgi:hypothetical protein